MKSAGLRKDFARVCSLLQRRFGSRQVFFGPKVGNPLDLLVATILSQNTSDANSSRAFAELKKRFPMWEQVIEASESQVVSTIKSGGLANLKARRIKQVLSEVERKAGALNLDCLEQMTAQSAREWLTEIKGIGPKTAAVVLAFGLGKHAMPLDTHCRRVLDRLGLVQRRMPDAKAHALVEELVEDKMKGACHSNLILLGRIVCKPVKPHCEECPLKTVCPLGSKRGTAV